MQINCLKQMTITRMCMPIYLKHWALHSHSFSSYHFWALKVSELAFTEKVMVLRSILRNYFEITPGKIDPSKCLGRF